MGNKPKKKKKKSPCSYRSGKEESLLGKDVMKFDAEKKQCRLGGLPFCGVSILISDPPLQSRAGVVGCDFLYHIG